MQPRDIYHDEDGDALPPPQSERISRFRDEIGVLDEAEAAGVIGWQPRTLQAARLTDGDVPVWRRVGRRVVYLKADVEAWLHRQPVHPGHSPPASRLADVKRRRSPNSRATVAA